MGKNTKKLHPASKNIIVRDKLRTTYKKQKDNTKKAFHTFKYVDKSSSKLIKDANIINRINSLRIPPAYTDVIISKNNNNSVQAIGTDDKGRKQYIYHPDYIKSGQNSKYKNIIKLGHNIEKIQRDVKKILNDASSKAYSEWIQPNTNIAIIIFLLDHCNFRIGNVKYMRLYNSYGASTLKGEHLKVKGNIANISFIGKKGVFNSSTVDDNIANKIFRTLKKEKGNKQLLFSTSNDTPITSDQINTFLQKYDPDITPKMFRTWYANYYFLEKLRKDMTKNNEFLVNMLKIDKINKPNKVKMVLFDKYKGKYINQCCDYISERLHNTASISKKSYLDYELVDNFSKAPTLFLNNIRRNPRTSNHQMLIAIIKKMDR